MREQIIILGAGGHARSMADSIEAQGQYEIAGFVSPTMDDSISYKGYTGIGTDDDLQELYHKGITRACIGIGYFGREHVREHLYEKLTEIGFEMPNIIDPSAVLASDVALGKACFIGKNAVINSNVRIGDCVIINTGSIIEHDCIVGDYSHVAVGTVICGGTVVGTGCFVGANATVIQGITLETGAIIGAGTVVRKDVSAGRMVV